MPRKSITAGARFGHLVALAPTAERKSNYVIWSCRCDCGRESRCSSRELTNGWRRACNDPACQYHQEIKNENIRHDDLTGQRFGKLVVVSRYGKDRLGRICWNCRCDCGGEIVAPTGQLKAGYRKSCGCLSRPPLKDWIGKRFGMLTVIAYDGKRSGKHWWKCRCDCGNEVTVCQSNLKDGHTGSCGCLNTPYLARTMVEGTCIETLRNAVEKKTIARNNSSGVRGVYQNKRTGKWCAQITFRGKTKYLGSYHTLQEARMARDRGMEVFEEFLAAYDAEKRNSDQKKTQDQPSLATNIFQNRLAEETQTRTTTA